MKPSQLIGGAALQIEDISLEGLLGIVYDGDTAKAIAYFQIRNGVRVEISKQSYDRISKQKAKK